MFSRTLAIFIWKHYKYHRYNWRVKLINMSMPILTGLVLLIILHTHTKPHLHSCENIPVEDYMFYVANLHSVSCINVVLLPIVQEKTSGVKEFLRISCRHSSWNLATFFVLQVLLSLSIFGVVLGTVWNLSMSKHYDMQFMVYLVVLYVVSNIAFWFAMSVLFNTGKLYIYIFHIGIVLF